MYQKKPTHVSCEPFRHSQILWRSVSRDMLLWFLCFIHFPLDDFLFLWWAPCARSSHCMLLSAWAYEQNMQVYDCHAFSYGVIKWPWKLYCFPMYLEFIDSLWINRVEKLEKMNKKKRCKEPTQVIKKKLKRLVRGIVVPHAQVGTFKRTV